jgi:hypothetical protein
LRNRCCRWAAWSVAALTLFRACPSAAAPAAEQPDASSASAPPAAAPAAAIAASAQIDPASLLLFAVDLDDLTLTDGLTAYGAPEDPLLPVGELSRLLELDIDVLPSERRIIGRIGEARRSLVVDLATGTVREGGRTLSLAPSEVALTQNEIFIKASALQRLLPVKFEVDPDALAMKITATELLPVQGRMQRMARRRDSPTEPQKDEVLRVATPYRFFSMPAFDVSLGAGLQSETPHAPFRYDVRVGADLLYSGFQGYVGSDEQGHPSSARVLFERRSVEGRLLGPLHARTIAVGDTFAPGLTLGPRSVGGRGVMISTVPLDETNIFNRVDLRGELPLGYDVELYVNDILRSGQATPTKGRYEFLNVPLSQGINVVRIVTYGPRGERAEQTRIVNVGSGALRRGEATFEFGLVQQEEQVVSLGVDNQVAVIASPGRGGWRAVGNLNYGVTAYLTLAGGFALVPTLRSDDYRQLYTLGARTSLFGFATQLDLAADERGATAASLGLAGQLFGISTVLRHVEFQSGFVDENGPGFDLTRPMIRRSEASFDGNVQIAGRVIPLSFRALRNQFGDGTKELSASARGSGSAAGLLMTTGLEYQGISGPNPSSNQLSGFFAASSYRSYRWQLRATLDYAIIPEFRARALAITADRDISEFLALRFGIGQSLEQFDSFNLTAAAIMKLRMADLFVNASYNNANQGWQLGLGLNFGLGYNPFRHRYAMTRPGPAAGGSVLFEAFLDRNNNGIFDAGDEPVPGVAVEGAERKAVTGPDGRVFITGVGAGATARLLVGLDNVENTQVQAPPSTIQFSPRGGSFTTIRYPMKPTGEVMIRLLLKREDGSRVGLSAARMQLIGDNGLTKEASTEFDGSVIFPDLPVGTYRLQLDPEQAQRLRMHLTGPLSVTIKGDGSFIPDAVAEVQFEPRPKTSDSDAAEGAAGDTGALEKQ